MKWASACVEHVLPLLAKHPDGRLTNALLIGKAWIEGKATTGQAMKASVQAHAAAREETDPIAIAIARAAGHAVATAHMADHSLGGALYALKALKAAGRPIEPEQEWQNKQLPAAVKELVLSARVAKEKSFQLR
jgi:hypothetical protein